MPWIGASVALAVTPLLLAGRFRSIAPIFGSDVVLQFHRQIGIVAVDRIAGALIGVIALAAALRVA